MTPATAAAVSLLERLRTRVAALDRPRAAWARMEIVQCEDSRRGESLAEYEAAVFALHAAGYYHPDRWLVANWPDPLKAIAAAIAALKGETT